MANRSGVLRLTRVGTSNEGIGDEPAGFTLPGGQLSLKAT
jgi:hypothetical protein